MRAAAHFNQTNMISLFYLDWASISRPVALIKRHELEAAFRESLHELMRSYPVSVIVRRRRKSITGQPNVAQDEVGSHLAARALSREPRVDDNL